MVRMLPPIVVGVALMVACAVVQGKFTERWTATQSDLVENWVKHMERLPRRIGDWEGTKLADSSEQVKSIAKFDGESNMAYTNRRTGEIVYVALMCGLGRNVSKHTPDKCMKGQGFNLGEKMVKYSVDCGAEKKPEFYTSMFAKESPDGTERERILWSWNDGTGWRAPSWPKVSYARTPAIYKLYLITKLTHMTDKIQESPATRFAEAFIPALNKTLFPAEAGAASEAARAADAKPAEDAKPEEQAKPAADTAASL